MDFDVGVVIAAAGLGTRLGGSVPKQYCKILEKPLMLHALEEFLNMAWVSRVVLVVDSPEMVRGLLRESGCDSQRVKVVKGEETRHRSIRAGLQELQRQASGELRVVVVHDGVRPLVPPALTQELVSAAELYGAAGAVRPLVSTVLLSTTDSFLQESLDRSKHVASETPQAFQTSLLATAYSKCSEEDLDRGTECLQLVLKYCGVKAKLVSGPEDLWKVTYRKDLHLAAAALKQRHNSVCIICADKDDVVSQLVGSVSTVAATVRHIESTVDVRDSETYNTIIVFHEQEIQQDTHLVNFAALLNTDKLGLIVHVIDNASVEGLQEMSVYSLSRSGRSMAHRYDKLHKGVVVVHCTLGADNHQLISLLTSLLQADPLTFSGQTFFV